MGSPQRKSNLRGYSFSTVDAAFRVVCDAGVKKKKEGLVVTGRRRCFEAIENLSGKLCYLSFVWHFHY